MVLSEKFILTVGIEEFSKLPESDQFKNINLVNLKSLLELKIWISNRNRQREILPDAIICNVPEDRIEIQSFFASKNFPKNLFSIPFILYSSDILSLEDKKELVSFPGIDDIFDNPINYEKLMERIKFLVKFKTQIKNYVPEVEESEPKQVGNYVGNFFKRGFDIFVSGLILVIASPFLLIIAIIIKSESKGPVFYYSNRAGSNYKIFKFIKFRTMYTGSDAKLKEMLHLNQYSNGDSNSQIFIKIASDPRITPFGSFLRNTSLDEIPQLINVLKGDMSLVGNRPLPLYEAVSLTKDEWVERFLAPAGITGLWQITKRGQKEMTVGERINLDINYANKNSFLYDLWILFRTPRALIQKENV